MSGVYKQRLDYFPLDADVFDSTKVRVLTIRHGCAGPAVYFFLLCKCYGEYGYWAYWEDIYGELYAEQHKLTLAQLHAVLDACLNLDLFDRTLFERCGILTSRGIQRRYLFAVRERAKKALRRSTVYTVDGSIWLLSQQETEEQLCAISPPHRAREPSAK